MCLIRSSSVTPAASAILTALVMDTPDLPRRTLLIWVLEMPVVLAIRE